MQMNMAVTAEVWTCRSAAFRADAFCRP